MIFSQLLRARALRHGRYSAPRRNDMASCVPEVTNMIMCYMFCTYCELANVFILFAARMVRQKHYRVSTVTVKLDRKFCLLVYILTGILNVFPSNLFCMTKVYCMGSIKELV